MDKQKGKNQDLCAGEVQIIVATSAFGRVRQKMGAIIHYEISNSLENYVQEQGGQDRMRVFRRIAMSCMTRRPKQAFHPSKPDKS